MPNRGIGRQGKGGDIAERQEDQCRTGEGGELEERDRWSAYGNHRVLAALPHPDLFDEQQGRLSEFGELGQRD